jgi:hypothetical protein
MSDRPETSDRYKVTAAGFLFCLDCGSLVMEGYRTEHDRLHPRISCSVLGCGVYHQAGHAWTDQFPPIEQGG